MTLAEKYQDLRNAIDGIELALMGAGDFVELPRIFESCRDDMEIAPRMTVGQMRQVCTALETCTRIINSDEYL